MTYIVKVDGKTVVKALPTMAAAKRIAIEKGGKALIDPTSIAR